MLGSKFTQFLKQKIGFSSNFAQLFSIKKHNSFVLFWLKFYRISTKGAYRSTNLVQFYPAVKSLKCCTLVGSFCKNHKKFQRKKVQKTYLSWHWRADMWFRIWHEEFSEFSPNHSKVQKFHFNGLFSVFLSKVCEVCAKKIQRSYLSWHWIVMQNLIKPWICGFKNGMRNRVNFN